MSPEFKKIYSIANNIANLVITEHGDNFVGISKITSIIKNDHLAQLLLSKVNSNSEKVKIVIATYFILNRKSQYAINIAIINEHWERTQKIFYFIQIEIL